MNEVRAQTPSRIPSSPPELQAPPPEAKSKAPAAPPLPYLDWQMFRKLENGGYAVTGLTGDAWDIAQAPEWRSKSRLKDAMLIQASNALGSWAFALNVVNNACARVLFDIPALLDEKLQQSLGIDFDTLALLARSATPGNPLDDIPFYLLARASEISRFAKSRIFREKLLIVAERMEHIEANHAWRKLVLPKSLFFPDVDKTRLIRQAESLPKIPQKGGRFVRIATDKELVGIDCQTGLPTKVYTVVSDAQGKVVTAHPGLPDPKFALP